MNVKPVIVIPCYNAADTVVETLDSVRRSITATGREIPVYVFNDNSKDNSLDVLHKYCSRYSGIHVIENKVNLREQGITNLAGRMFVEEYDWMFIIHADDIAKEDWLNTIIDEIEANRDSKLFTVWSSFDTFNPVTGAKEKGDDTGAIQKKVRDKAEIKENVLQIYASFHISGAALSLKPFEDFGGYDTRFVQIADSDLFLKGLIAGYSDIYISRTLTEYRILPTSVSAVSRATNRDIREVYLLMEKYGDMLSSSDRKLMVRHCLSLSSKRLVKSIGALSLSGVKNNVFELIKALGRYIKTG